MREDHYDTLIIGAGVAGLAAAQPAALTASARPLASWKRFAGGGAFGARCPMGLVISLRVRHRSEVSWFALGRMMRAVIVLFLLVESIAVRHGITSKDSLVD